MKKLKGIKFRADGIINDFPQIKCKDGSLSYSVMGCENRGGVSEIDYPEEYGGYGRVGPPKECPPGTMHDRTRGGLCVDIELLKKEGKFKESVFSDLFPKCGPETGTEPDGKGGCRPIGRLWEPQTQADCPEGTKFKPRGCKPPQKCTNNRNTCEGTPLSPVTTKNMAVGSNWLLPALLIGAGIFILTRKSE